MTGFIFSAVLLLIAGFLFYRRWKVNAGMKALRAQKFQRIKSVVDKFDNGQIPTADEVRPFAFNIATGQFGQIRNWRYSPIWTWPAATLFQ